MGFMTMWLPSNSKIDFCSMLKHTTVYTCQFIWIGIETLFYRATYNFVMRIVIFFMI